MPGFRNRLKRLMTGKKRSGVDPESTHPTAVGTSMNNDFGFQASGGNMSELHIKEQKRPSRKPSGWFRKHHDPVALTSISEPTFLGYGGASTGGAYLNEQAALSNLVLMDQDRYREAQADRRRQYMSKAKEPSLRQMNASQPTEVCGQEFKVDESTNSKSPAHPSRFHEDVPVDRQHPLNEDLRVLQSLPSEGTAAAKPLSWVKTPVSMYFPRCHEERTTAEIPTVPRVGIDAHCYQPKPPSSMYSQHSQQGNKTNDSPTLPQTLPYTNQRRRDSPASDGAHTAGLRLTNGGAYSGVVANISSLYDGSPWGPVSPRTIQSQVFPPKVQDALQERLINNTRNRLSLPTSLRFGSPISAVPSSKHPLNEEFRLSITPATAHDPLSDSHSMSYLSADSSTSTLQIPPHHPADQPASKTKVAAQHPFHAHLTVPSHYGEPAGPTKKFITRTELVGSPFALPYRSHSTMFDIAGKRTTSIRQRRGFGERLLVATTGGQLRFIDRGREDQQFRYPLGHSEGCWADQAASMV